MASNRNGRIEFEIRANSEQLRRDAAAAISEIRRIGGAAQSMGEKLDDTFKRLGGTMVSIFTIQQAAVFAKEIVRVRGEVEALEISFETLLGNRSKAEALMSEIKTFASSTPMQLGDLAKGAQTLLGFNIEAEKVMPILRQIGDISMGSAERFNSLILAFSQMSSTGKLMGQDLLQMINAGFNPLATIAEQTGKSIGELKEEMSAGSISAEMVANAFASAAGEGGKFYGMLDKQSQGIAGSLSNLQGAIEDMFNAMGTENQGIITDVISGATELVQNYKTVGETLAVLIGVYGAYKVALMTTATVSNMAATGEIALLTKLLPVKEASANADIVAAVASGKMSAAKGEELIAIRAEVGQKLNELKINHQLALSEAATARAASHAARLRAFEAGQVLQQKRVQLSLAIATGNQANIELAQQELLMAQREASIAGQVRQSAVTAAATARTKANAAALAVDTMQQEINNASTNKLAISKSALGAAMIRLKSIIMSHPYAILAAAIAAVGYAIYKLVTYQTDAEKMQEKLNETIREGEASVEADRIEVEILFDRLRKAKKGTEEWDTARKSIMNKYGQYLKSLGDEKTALDDIAKAQNAVTRGVLETARARLMESTARKAADELAKKETDTYEHIQSQLEEYLGADKAREYMPKIRPVIEGAEMTDEVKRIIAEFDNAIKNSFFGVERKIEVQLKDVQDSRDVLQKTMSDLKDKYGEISTTDTTRQGQNVFDAMGASLQQLESELPRAQAKLEQLKTDLKNVDLSDGKGGERINSLEKEIASQKNLIISIEETAKARERELHTIAEIEDRIKQLKDEQKQFGKDDAGYQDRENRINYLQTKLPDKNSARSSGSSKKDEDPATVLDRITKMREEEARVIVDLEYKRQREEIEAQEDGINKTLALLSIEHEIRLDKIKRDEEDLLKLLRENAKKEFEAKNPKWKEEGLKFEDSEEYKNLTQKEDQQKKNFDSLRNSDDADYSQKQQKAYKDELKDYEDYANKYLSMSKEFEDNIKKLKEQQVQQQELKKKGKFDGEVISDETIKNVEATQQSILAGLDDEMGIKDEMFETFIGGLVNIGVGAVEEKIRELQEKLDQAKKELQDAGKTDDAVKITQMQAKVKTLEQQLSEAGKVNADTNKVNADDPAKKWKKTLSVMSDVKDITNDIAEGFGGLDDSTKAIIDSAMNIATGVINMIIGITTLATSSAAATTATAKTSATAIKAVEKASVILAIISAAIQVVMAIAKLLNNIFSKDKKRDKEIAKIQGSVDTLKRSYDALGKAIDKAYSTNAAQMIKQQDANLRQQKKLIEEQMRLEKDKKKTDDGKVQQYQEALDKIDEELAQTQDRVTEAIIGTDVKSAIDEFAEAYIDAWAAGEDKAKAMKDVVKNMIKSAVTQLMKSKMKDEVQRFMDKLTTAMEDNMLSAAEEKELDYFASIIEKKGNELEGVFDKYIKDEEAQREASSTGMESMSQDSANELNGRFALLTVIMSDIRDIATSIKSEFTDLIQNSNMTLKYLAGIETNTARLAAIENNLSSVKRSIDDISVKGIIIRK
jgi:tape measure domain-containing protein